MIRTTTILLLIIAVFSTEIKAQLPTRFVDQMHSNNWQIPTGLTFDANGKMYVWEKAGKVHIVQNNVKTLFIDISAEVFNYNDHGLNGFALDPNFLSNGYIYMMYVAKRCNVLGQSCGTNSTFQTTIGRIVRYTATFNVNGFPSINYSSRLVLVGETISTGIPILADNHGVGSLVFGKDGTLLASIGDSAFPSPGSNEPWLQEAVELGIVDNSQLVNAYRSQLLNSLNGKILRINPSSGDGISSNPFFDNNNKRSAQSRIWTYGMRNPFRFTVKPGTGSNNPVDGNPGTLYVGDVGWTNREELNIIETGGKNGGWPKYEGINYSNTDFQDEAYNFSNHHLPTIDWRGTIAQAHINNATNAIGDQYFTGEAFNGNASIGGVFYTGISFPAQYQNKYFQGDYSGWIKEFDFSINPHTNTTSISVEKFGDGIHPTCFAVNPVDGGIYYTNYFYDVTSPIQEVRKLFYDVNANFPPTAIFTATPSYGTNPLTVQFDGSQSSDPEFGTLTYMWDFGDGSAVSNQVSPSHVFTTNTNAPTSYMVNMKVTDPAGKSSSDMKFISINNTPPVIHSTSIDTINCFSNTSPLLLNLDAQITDNEHSSSEMTYRWSIILHHEEHSHLQTVINTLQGQAVLDLVPNDGQTYYYEVTLSVKDAANLSTIYVKNIYPNCAADTISPESPWLKLYDHTATSFKLSWNSVHDNVAVNTYEVFINGISQGLLNYQTLSYQYTSATSIENQVFQCYVKVKDFAGNENTSSKLNFTKLSISSGVITEEYLSNLTPSSSTNGFGPIEIDKSNGGEAANDGTIITLNGTTYSKGIGVHANSEIIYNFPPNIYNTFSAKIGIDDEMTNIACGSVVFKVFKNNILAYESPIMIANTGTITLQLDLTNTTQLKLVADAGQNTNCDHGDWADAKLLSINDKIPPTTPLNLSSVQLPNTFQISWNASTDNLDTNIEYEIVIDNVVYATTAALQSNLPVLAQGNHIITIQAKDDSGNRAVSNTIRLIYVACPSTIELLKLTDNFQNQTIILNASAIVRASNIILGTSNVIYQAANKIELLPGFSVNAGSVFIAHIQGCDN
jgi:glucose/arabinose dehydrogenase